MNIIYFSDIRELEIARKVNVKIYLFLFGKRWGRVGA